METHVKERGGSQFLGWAIFEIPGVWIEAEFHAVWKQTDETLLDLTPRKYPLENLLFLPDPARKYRGEPIPPEHFPLTDDRSVVRLIHVFRRIAEERQGTRKSKKSAKAVAATISRLETEANELMQLISPLIRKGMAQPPVS